MTRSRIFVVDDATWPEHNKVGIAAINDPVTTHPQSSHANAQRQSAIAEISGIRPGDVLFFNLMVSERHPPQILGVFEATSRPYFDPSPVFQGARHVRERLPFRVAFKCIRNLPNPVNIEEIWALKDKGRIWTLQQSRGDAVGVHACVGVSRIEAKLIGRLLSVSNIAERPVPAYLKPVIRRKPLPIDLRTRRDVELHYEAALKAMLLEDLADRKHDEIFGDYDDFIPNLPTGARKEIDIMILKYDRDDILWYQILELKSGQFEMGALQALMGYENWIIRSKAENPLQVYPVAVASRFRDEVVDFVRRRKEYNERPIRLIKYRFDKSARALELKEVE